ncbi:hypothetical protein APHAL10511_007751 [Amanita phalloides]|nr:hypothetical protein APHAL10511_007751 [Amanita phalloides]
MGENQQTAQPATSADVNLWGTAIIDAIKTSSNNCSLVIPMWSESGMGQALPVPAGAMAQSNPPRMSADVPVPTMPPLTEPAMTCVTSAQPTSVCIPDLWPGEWQRALKQWHEGEPAASLQDPLRDWKPEHYKGQMHKKVGSKWHI